MVGKLRKGENPDVKLLESMRLDPIDGVPLIELHMARLSRTAVHFQFATPDTEAIRQDILSYKVESTVKLRLLYSSDGSYELTHEALQPLIEPIRLRLAPEPIPANIDKDLLSFKTTQREVYDSFAAQKADAADVVLYNRDGFVTETTIFNLFIMSPAGVLMTPPATLALLEGVYRQHLLNNGAQSRLIHVDELQDAGRIYVSNAVRGLLAAELAA